METQTRVYSIAGRETISDKPVSFISRNGQKWYLWCELNKALNVPTSWLDRQQSCSVVVEIRGKRCMRVVVTESAKTILQIRTAREIDIIEAPSSDSEREVLPPSTIRPAANMNLLEDISDSSAESEEPPRKKYRVPLQFVPPIAERVKLSNVLRTSIDSLTPSGQEHEESSASSSPPASRSDPVTTQSSAL